MGLSRKPMEKEREQKKTQTHIHKQEIAGKVASEFLKMVNINQKMLRNQIAYKQTNKNGAF